MPLTIDLTTEGPAQVLTLVGDLDYAECAALRVQIDKILREQPTAVIVDLAALDYLDSSGLGLLLSLSKELSAAGGKLILVTNETVDNILSLTRLSGIFATASDMPEATAMAEV